MAVRPSWEGHLRLSQVTCPVALCPATTRRSAAGNKKKSNGRRAA
jgi:non-homologous end joining protein Ku